MGAHLAPAFDHHPRGDEALHQIAVVRPHIGFEQRDIHRLQSARQFSQLPKMRRVDAYHRFLLKSPHLQRAQLHAWKGAELGFDRRPVPRSDKRDRGLGSENHLPGAGLRRQPQLDFRAGRSIAPMAGEDEALGFDHGNGKSGARCRRWMDGFALVSRRGPGSVYWTKQQLAGPWCQAICLSHSSSEAWGLLSVKGLGDNRQ